MTQINYSPWLGASENPSSFSKRQRKPSQFASSIKSFKELCDKTSKKGKPDYPQPDQTSAQNRQIEGNRITTLKCLLPSGKKLNLSVIIKKRTIKKARKQISFKAGGDKQTEVCPQEPATTSAPGCDLLSKFLLAAEELNKLEQEQKEKQKNELNQPLHLREELNTYREGKVRAEKDDSEKLQRFVERSRILSSKLQSLISDMCYL